MLKRTKTNLIVDALIMLAVAVFCFATPQGTVSTLAWILGALFIVGGVVTFFVGRRKEGGVDVLHLVAALLMAAVGIIIIVRPNIIAILVGLVILVEGIDFAAMSLRYRKAGVPYWGALLAVGALVILLGLWAVLSPWVGATMLSIIIGVGCLGVFADCVMALVGIGRVEGFVKEAKGAIQEQVEASQQVQEAEEVTD